MSEFLREDLIWVLEQHGDEGSDAELALWRASDGSFRFEVDVVSSSGTLILDLSPVAKIGPWLESVRMALA